MTPPSRHDDDAPNVFAGVLIFSPDFPSIFGPRPGNMVPSQNSLFVTVLYMIPFLLHGRLWTLASGLCFPLS